MIGIHLSPFLPESRSATLARLLAEAGLQGASAQVAAGGKPFLKGKDGHDHGLSITHLRKASPPLSLMAVGESPYLGIDAELWPQGPGDPAFLATVAAPEDEALIARLRAAGLDPGTCLWVAKEAALKASGAVMTEPRDIFVEPSINGHLWAATSRNSRKPIPAAHMRICRLSAKAQGLKTLLAVAISGDFAPAARREAIMISAPGLDLEAPF